MSPMPGNTEEHQLRLKERRAVLTQTLGGILQPGQGFVWEVGSGHGHFLTALAQSNPAQTFIGIDIAKDRVARGQRKQARARLPRLHFLQAEATDFLEARPPGNVIEATYILFPDPWPKRRHEKNRLIQPEFLAQLASRSAPRARLHFRTDHSPYFRDAHTRVAQHPGWRLLDPKEWGFDYETIFQQKAPSFESLVAERI